MSTFSIYRTLIMILMPLSFFACDKDGNPILSDINFKCEINGVKYKDQMPILLPPGAQRSPVITHVKYNENDYIQFSSLLTPEDEQTGQSEYSVIFRIPMNENVLLSQAYQFEPIEGKEILEGLDNLIYLEGNTQFVRIYSFNYNVDTHYYGKGTVVFTEFDLTSHRAKGKVEFTFPYLSLDGKSEELHLNGEFYSWVKSDY